MNVSGKLESHIFRRLVLVYSIQYLALSLTGMVDCSIGGWFCGADGLAAMKLAMPVFAVTSFVGSTLGSGLSVTISKVLAGGDRGQANQIFRSGLAAACGMAVFLMLAGLLFPETLTIMLAGKATDPALLKQVTGYLLPVLFGSLPIILYDLLTMLAALEGANRQIARSAIAILFTDIAGDLIAVRLDAGVMGIAVASVAAYLIACLIVAAHFFSKKTMFRMGLPTAPGRHLRNICTAGYPWGLRYLCAFFCPLLINRAMLLYGTLPGLAALSIEDAVRYLPECLCEGIAATVLLLTGIFAAEQDRKALLNERHDIIRFCLIGCTVTAAVLILAAPLLIMLFTGEETVRFFGIRAFRWYLAGLPFLGINLACTAYLQGLGKERTASLLVALNQLLLPAAFAWLLGRTFGTQGIFAALAVHQIVLALGFGGWLLARKLSTKYGWYGMESWTRTVAEVHRMIETMDQVTDASREVIALCESYGVDKKRATHIGLCLEELAANSVEHGFRDGKPHHLDIRFAIGEKWLVLRLRDDCRPYDLTEQYKLLHPDDPFSHIGLRLVYASADDVSYSHALDLNNVCIRIAR